MIKPLTDKAADSIKFATRRFNIWEGAVRASKTVSSLIAWLKFVRTGPAGPLLMAGKTERTLKRNIINPLIEMLGIKRCRLVAGEGELWICGRLIYLVGANDEKAQDKIRGMTLAGAYVDEITTVPESFFSMLKSRLSIDGSRLYGTTNPDNPTHWLYTDFLKRSVFHIDRNGDHIHNLYGQGEEEPLDLARFSFVIDDNPMLPKSYVENIKKEYTGLYYRRFILGEWCQAEGAIYDMWDPDLHVVSRIPAITRWISCGVDYGTAGVFAAILIGMGENGKLYLTSEHGYDARKTQRQKTDPEHAGDFIEWLAKNPQVGPVRPEWICIDPSATSFIMTLRRRGVLGVRTANNSVLDGIRTLAGLLATRRLLVHQSCTGIIDEFPGYMWDRKASVKGEDKPLKQNDHYMDALRYAIETPKHIWQRLIAPEQDSPIL